MGFFIKSYKLLTKLTPISSGIIIFTFFLVSFLVSYSSTINDSLIGIIGTFIALFSGIIFSFSFLMFDASKKKKNELIQIFEELGITYNSFKKDRFLPENEKYNQSNVFNKLRYIYFAENLFVLITLLVIVSIIIFILGIALGISLDFSWLLKFQLYLNRVGLFFYSLFVCIYVWIVSILVVRVYRFYMFELKL